MHNLHLHLCAESVPRRQSEWGSPIVVAVCGMFEQTAKEWGALFQPNGIPHCVSRAFGKKIKRICDLREFISTFCGGDPIRLVLHSSTMPIWWSMGWWWDAMEPPIYFYSFRIACNLYASRHAIAKRFVSYFTSVKIDKFRLNCTYRASCDP